jgi:hypothetical protein
VVLEAREWDRRDRASVHVWVPPEIRKGQESCSHVSSFLQQTLELESVEGNQTFMVRPNDILNVPLSMHFQGFFQSRNSQASYYLYF